MWCWCWRIKTGLRGSGVTARGFRCVVSTRVALFIVWSRTINSTNTIIYFNMTPHTIFSSPSRLVSMGMKSSHWAAGPRVFSRSNNKRLLNQSFSTAWWVFQVIISTLLSITGFNHCPTFSFRQDCRQWRGFQFTTSGSVVMFGFFQYYAFILKLDCRCTLNQGSQTCGPGTTYVTNYSAIWPLKWVFVCCWVHWFYEGTMRHVASWVV